MLNQLGSGIVYLSRKHTKIAMSLMTENKQVSKGKYPILEGPPKYAKAPGCNSHQHSIKFIWNNRSHVSA